MSLEDKQVLSLDEEEKISLSKIIFICSDDRRILFDKNAITAFLEKFEWPNLLLKGKQPFDKKGVYIENEIHHDFNFMKALHDYLKYGGNFSQYYYLEKDGNSLEKIIHHIDFFSPKTIYTYCGIMTQFFESMTMDSKIEIFEKFLSYEIKNLDFYKILFADVFYCNYGGEKSICSLRMNYFYSVCTKFQDKISNYSKIMEKKGETYFREDYLISIYEKYLDFLSEVKIPEEKNKDLIREEIKNFILSIHLNYFHNERRRRGNIRIIEVEIFNSIITIMSEIIFLKNLKLNVQNVKLITFRNTEGETITGYESEDFIKNFSIIEISDIEK